MGQAGHTSTGCGDMSVKRAWGPAKYISVTAASHNRIYKLGQKLNLIPGFSVLLILERQWSVREGLCQDTEMYNMRER